MRNLLLDNGPHLHPAEEIWRAFLEHHRPVLTPIATPQANAIAERLVGTFRGSRAGERKVVSEARPLEPDVKPRQPSEPYAAEEQPAEYVGRPMCPEGDA